MYFWSKFPFLRITISFMLGIVASVFIPEYQITVLGLFAFLFMLMIILNRIKHRYFLTANWLYGLLLILLSVCAGYIRLFNERETAKENHLVHLDNIEAYRAIVISQPAQRGKFYKCIIDLQDAKNGRWQHTIGQVNLYVRTSQKPFEYGDEVLIIGNPQLVQGPINPGEFNYKRYLGFLNIYHQQFADSSEVHILSHNKANRFISASIQTRAYFSNVIDDHIKGEKEQAISNALLLGNKDSLDSDIKNTYAASGAMHVLAVSGLHVGIIYLIILLIIKHTLRDRKKEWMVAIIAIPLLWGYAFITGLSPSVLRAVTLFSILALGKAWGRKAEMINMLAVSAFILLLYDPFLLMQVGFQLSYVAVMGIIYVYPLIRRIWLPSARIWIFIWDITAISIAAQIATFPLSILYFHRFAPYFLVSNLLVIPAATIIVWLGVLLFSVSWISVPLAGWVGNALEKLIWLVNYVLSGIYHLPGSDWNNLYLDVPQTWTLYLIIAGLILFVLYRNKEWAIFTNLGMIVLSVLIGFRWVQNNQSKQIVVYRIPNYFAVDFIQSGVVYSVMDSSLMHNKDNIHFRINPQRLSKGAVLVKRQDMLAWKQLPYGKAIVWNGFSILISEGKLPEKELPFHLVLDAKSNKLNNALIIDLDSLKRKDKN